jgi:hypothetical protein
MKTVIQTAVLPFVFILSTYCSMAQFSAGDVKMRLAQEYLKKSMISDDVSEGLRKTLDSLVPLSVSRYRDLSKKEQKAMQKVVIELLAAIDLEKILVETISDTYTEDEIRALIAWVSTKDGQSIQRKSINMSQTLQTRIQSAFTEIVPSIQEKLMSIMRE